eukprot:scaffold4278_cov263-Pinguiococcus_pyrenoidosus.AAC.5
MASRAPSIPRAPCQSTPSQSKMNASWLQVSHGKREALERSTTPHSAVVGAASSLPLHKFRRGLFTAGEYRSAFGCGREAGAHGGFGAGTNEPAPAPQTECRSIKCSNSAPQAASHQNGERRSGWCSKGHGEAAEAPPSLSRAWNGAADADVEHPGKEEA